MLGLHPKVVTAAVAGALTTIVVWAAGQFGHIVIPGDVAAAITTIVAFIGGYSTSST